MDIDLILLCHRTVCLGYVRYAYDPMQHSANIRSDKIDENNGNVR